MAQASISAEQSEGSVLAGLPIEQLGRVVAARLDFVGSERRLADLGQAALRMYYFWVGGEQEYHNAIVDYLHQKPNELPIDSMVAGIASKARERSNSGSRRMGDFVRIFNGKADELLARAEAVEDPDSPGRADQMRHGWLEVAEIIKRQNKDRPKAKPANVVEAAAVTATVTSTPRAAKVSAPRPEALPVDPRLSPSLVVESRFEAYAINKFEDLPPHYAQLTYEEAVRALLLVTVANHDNRVALEDLLNQGNSPNMARALHALPQLIEHFIAYRHSLRPELQQHGEFTRVWGITAQVLGIGVKRIPMDRVVNIIDKTELTRVMAIMIRRVLHHSLSRHADTERRVFVILNAAKEPSSMVA